MSQRRTVEVLFGLTRHGTLEGPSTLSNTWHSELKRSKEMMAPSGGVLCHAM